MSAYNTSNWDAYKSLLCPHMRDQFVGAALDALQQGRNQTGLLNIIVGTISVRGDTASAVVTQQQEHGQPPDRGSFALVRDSEGWKTCVS